MKIKIFFVLLWVITSSVYSQEKANKLTKQEQQQKWELLFDGKSTDKWRSENSKSFPKKGWEIIDECLVSKGGGNILSLEEYGNFEFKWDWKMESVGGNSGIKYFVKEFNDPTLGKYLGIEYQMLDDGKMDPASVFSLGSVYELYPPSTDKKAKPVGEWNQSLVISKGLHVEHWLNGFKVAEYERGSADFKGRVSKSKFKNVNGFGLQPKGLLMLTDHGATVYFKNLKVQKL